MELSYPALEGINSPKQYQGPIVLLSYLDAHYGGCIPRYACGHRAARVFMFKTPKVLYKMFKKQYLLASVGSNVDVILFDPERLKGKVSGHREMTMCPRCFFEKALGELDPVCPKCAKRIRNGQIVCLVRYSQLNLAQKRFVKVLKVNFEGVSWAVCCCARSGSASVLKKQFIWDGDARDLRNL